MKFKHQKLSKEELISRSIRRLTDLKGSIMMGGPESIKTELDLIDDLLEYNKNQLTLAENDFYNTELDKQIKELERIKTKKISSFGLIQSLYKSADTSTEDLEIKNLNLKRLDTKFFSLSRLNLNIHEYRKLNVSNQNNLISYRNILIQSLNEAQKRLDHRTDSKINKENQRKIQEDKIIEQHKRTAALAGAYTGISRQIAQNVKKSLEYQRNILDFCPYCGDKLGDIPHADHIYPVAKGGLSTKENMVLVCQPCNTKKNDKLLRQFIKINNLDPDFIYKNLELLDKDF